MHITQTMLRGSPKVNNRVLPRKKSFRGHLLDKHCGHRFVVIQGIGLASRVLALVFRVTLLFKGKCQCDMTGNEETFEHENFYVITNDIIIYTMIWYDTKIYDVRHNTIWNRDGASVTVPYKRHLSFTNQYHRCWTLVVERVFQIHYGINT